LEVNQQFFGIRHSRPQLIRSFGSRFRSLLEDGRGVEQLKWHTFRDKSLKKAIVVCHE